MLQYVGWFFLNEKAPAYYGYTYSFGSRRSFSFFCQFKMAQLGIYAQDEYNIKVKIDLWYQNRYAGYGEDPIPNPK